MKMKFPTTLQKLYRPRPRRLHSRRRSHTTVPVQALEDRIVLNGSPVFSASTIDLSVDEDASGTSLGTISATDPDGDFLYYQIVSGDPNYTFYLDSGGDLYAYGYLDYETTSSYSLTVEASDGMSSAYATVNISVNDVAEAPVFSPTTYSFSVNEDASYGTVVGTLTASDPQADPLMYTITDGDPTGSFYVDSGGNLVASGMLDYESTPSYTLTIEVSDGMETDSATVTVTVNDVVEAPEFSADSYTASVSEHTTYGIIAILTATDPQNDILMYSITEGDPLAAFYIDSGGQLCVSGTLDYETQIFYYLTVEVSDGTETDTATVTVTVTDVNEAPMINNFSVAHPNSTTWTFFGEVWDESPGSLIITFGGLLAGHTVMVDTDGPALGSFSYSIDLPPGTDGLVSASTVDLGGLASNVPEQWVYPY